MKIKRLVIGVKSHLISGFSQLTEDQLHLSRRERAAAEVTEMWECRIDGDPLAELVPGCLRAKLEKVLKGELRAPEWSGRHGKFEIWSLKFEIYDYFVIMVQRYEKILRITNENSL